MSPWIVLLIVLLIIVIGLAVLYFLGKKAQKKQEAQQEQIEAAKQYYTGETWGKAEHYDLCIDTGVLGIDQTVELILDYLNLRK